MQYNFSELNALSIADVYTNVTGLGTKPCGTDCVEPEDETCPLCGHRGCFRLHTDTNQAHCYSCDDHSSVIDLVMKLCELSSPVEAASSITKMVFESYTPVEVTRAEPEPDIRNLDRVAEINVAIAEYYHRNLVGNMSAFAYQSATRGHKPETVMGAKVGYADGKLVAALVGFSEEEILETGMARLQNGRLVDFAPAGVYVYPHYIDGKVARFTFKDPTKEFKFQQPKRHWLPSACWYGQDSLERPGAIALVEGENDRLALMEVYDGPVLASIGSISREQAEFIQSLGREVRTYFDNDDAGNKYRTKFPDALHYIVPEPNGDIDEYIRQGNDWGSLKVAQVFTTKAELIEPRAPGVCGPESFNDTGNANSLARRFGQDLRYVRETDSFLQWGGRWVPAGVQILEHAKRTAAAVLADGQVLLQSDNEDTRSRGEATVKYASQLHNLPKLKAMIELVKPKLEICTANLDADPMLLGINNGAIELRTGEYRENRRDDLITRFCPVDYYPQAGCPTWERFIMDITCGDLELASFLQRLVGYFLTGRTDEQLLFFFYGHGSNGKSTFIQTVQSLMGSYATQINSDVLMVNRNNGGPNASLAKLPGKRLVVANELPENGRFDETLIKAMTGGDTLVARQVYGKHEIEFMAQFSLLIIGNHKPVIHDMSHGMWRRMCLIPFAAQFSAGQADPTLPAKLHSELPGILNWALVGVTEWQQQGLKRSLPDAVVTANNEYREESDLLGEFLEGCYREPDAYSSATELYRAFQMFACEGNEWKMTQRVFNKKMAERGFAKVRRDSKAGFRGVAVVDTEMAQVFEPTPYIV
ncbi:phage/plasmid primase, P4 family [Pantoea sp. B65]|uniref:phage/plasmid primase, P4 family n=1 Tax=Pantoea sp. B65 TaxID=2813359 RepID=UPI0039B467D5